MCIYHPILHHEELQYPSMPMGVSLAFKTLTRVGLSHDAPGNPLSQLSIWVVHSSYFCEAPLKGSFRAFADRHIYSRCRRYLENSIFFQHSPLYPAVVLRTCFVATTLAWNSVDVRRYACFISHSECIYELFLFSLNRMCSALLSSYFCLSSVWVLLRSSGTK